MKITLESTEELQTWRGVRCRLWQGTTEGGITIYALVPRVAVPVDEDQSAFEREFIAQPHAPAAIDMRMII